MRLLVPLLLLLSGPASAGTSLVTWDLDDPLATDCPVCEDTYHCVDGAFSTLWADQLTFDDPVPAGEVVVGVDVLLQGVFGCEAPSGASLFLNDALIEDAALPGACDCGSCEGHSLSATAADGWADYAYGGENALRLEASGNFCVASLELTLTWGLQPAGDDDDSAGPPPGDDDDAVWDDDDDATYDDDDAADDDDDEAPPPDPEEDGEVVPQAVGGTSRGFCSAGGAGGALLALLPLARRRQRRNSAASTTR